ncbi:hypothetical protein PQO03_03400 [Lentisphaera profundi]|uniref:DUF4241 domain-containing protein n=1 Tax=Lentisphaera profundi TaxID=1658616 RepID=A0ABY7VSX7_9BACT|nr:hypothetical protein [Lentisphaera profundi]WDE97006.1 hypothetical protein PQO03_03400 [Lentisphaera profundi]
MNFNYKSIDTHKPNSEFQFDGHSVFLKAKTYAGDFIFAEVGDEHEDLYVLVDKGTKQPALHFHLHPELPMGNRADLLNCPWLFDQGDFESDVFADSLFNQVEKQDFTYAKEAEFRGSGKIDSWEGEGECSFAFALYHCDESPSSPYFIVCEYGDGADSQICCMIGDLINN